MKRVAWVAVAAFFVACGSAHAQQSVILTARGVADCGVGLPVAGAVGQPITLATDANGHLCVIVNVSGATGGTSSNYGAAFPATGTAAGFSDGTNMQAARAFDGDTGAGTQYVLGTVLRKSASGGSVEAGTASDPWRVDPTGTTTQPVSGTVTANLGTLNGAATAALQPTNAAQASTTAGQTGPLVQGAAVSTPPTWSAGLTYPLTMDVSGNLRTSVSGGNVTAQQSGTWNVGLTGTLPAFAATPTFNCGTGCTGGGGTSSTVGSAFPSTATAIGVKDSAGTNMTFLQADASNNLNVKINGGGITSGTAGTPSVDVVSVQGVSGGTPQSVSLTSGTSSYQETTITTGGTAVSLFSGATPTNGFEVINNDAVEDLYCREAGTATVAGATSIKITASSAYNTPTGYKPSGLVSCIASTTAHPLIARRW